MEKSKMSRMSRLGHGGVNLGFSKKAFLGFLESFLFLFFLLHFHVGDLWWRTISLKSECFSLCFHFMGLIHSFIVFLEEGKRRSKVPNATNGYFSFRVTNQKKKKRS